MGLRLVVEVADAHARWAHRKTLKTAEAVTVCRAKASEFRGLAKGEIPANHLGLREWLMEWADLLGGLDGEFVFSTREGGA